MKGPSRRSPAETGKTVRHGQARPVPDGVDPVCGLCGGGGVFALRTGDRFYAAASGEASLFRCRVCRCLFQWPMPGREAIASFYPGGYWQEAPEKGMLRRLQTIYIGWMLKWDLMRWVERLRMPPRGDFLDIGCSRGDWLALIARAGYRPQGIESDPRAARYARERLGIEVAEMDAESWNPQPGAFDAIGLFHLLEHVSRPGDLLRQCHHGLRPGGKLLIRVPNERSWQARLLGKRWKGLEVPRHLYHFNPTALHGLLDRSGFRVVRQSTWSLRDGPPALASSLFRSGEPTWQQVHGRPSGRRIALYLALTWLATPSEWLAALFGGGAMSTVIAQKV